MEQPDSSGADRTPLESARSLASSFVALLSARVELALVELREQGERSKQMAVLAAVAGTFLAMAALLLAFFVVLVFWDSHRLVAAAAITALYFAIGGYAVARLARLRRESPPPFEATLAELSADAEALGRGHE